jgi:hypothetical protein
MAGVFACCVLPASAHAGFPGQAGLLVAGEGTGGDNVDIVALRVDGTQRTRLTDSPAREYWPVWSRDGRQIAYARWTGGDWGGIPQPWVMNADGSGQRRVTAEEGIPTSWGPDDDRLLIVRGPDIYTVRLDGTGFTHLTGNAGNLPQWSPDGARIAFNRGHEIWSMRPDGSHAQVLIPRRSEGEFLGSLDWSPDGSKLAYFVTPPEGGYLIEVADVDGSERTTIHTLQPLTRPLWSPDGYKILITPYLMNPDGTNKDRVDLRANSWQPLVGTTGHARPRAAPSVRFALVPAYRACIDPFYTHGPPIAEGSCTPDPASTRLTVGTPDANARPAESLASVRLDVLGGDAGPGDADVAVRASVTDVRDRETLADHTGELGVRATVRIADRDNSPPTGPRDAATTIDAPLGFALACRPTAGPSGATCELATTLDALVPGTVKQGRRAVWNIDAVRVFDGGADGRAGTGDGEALFMTQGLFIR